MMDVVAPPIAPAAAIMMMKYSTTDTTDRHTDTRQPMPDARERLG